MKNNPQYRTIQTLIALLVLSLPAIQAQAATVISSGHADVFEAEYEDGVLHLGVHAGEEPGTHYEPGAVILQVNYAAYRSTVGLQGAIETFLGPYAWILPVDLEEAEALGVLEAGVAKAGFPNSNDVTFTMVSAGAANPGKFVLFSGASSNFTRLQANGGLLEVNSFSISGGHIHYNWGFSAAGTYTFDMQASYTDPDFGPLQSQVETYTFNVIPEPSSGALLLAGMAVLAAVRRRRL